MYWNDPFFVRNLTYGLEDSLISTTGLLAGITFAGMPNNYVVIAGVILVLVEGLSMGFGSLVSEESFMITAKTKYTMWKVLFYAFTMFISYVVAGAVVLAPYALNMKDGYILSIALAIVLLFVLIYMIQRDITKAILMTCIGTVILALSILTGKFLETQTRKQSDSKST